MTKRELIDTGTDKRFVRRDEQGRFDESDDVGRSLASDQKRDSQNKPPRGEGDKGDRWHCVRAATAAAIIDELNPALDETIATRELLTLLSLARGSRPCITDPSSAARSDAASGRE